MNESRRDPDTGPSGLPDPAPPVDPATVGPGESVDPLAPAVDPATPVSPESSPVSGMAGPAYAGSAPIRPGARRTSEDIRADIERQRHELGSSVEALRGKVNELTDWRGQVREHRREIAIGAAAIGFAVGAAIMLGRRGRG